MHHCMPGGYFTTQPVTHPSPCLPPNDQGKRGELGVKAVGLIEDRDSVCLSWACSVTPGHSAAPRRLAKKMSFSCMAGAGTSTGHGREATGNPGSVMGQAGTAEHFQLRPTQ
jgi:hypothetical protein